MPSKSTVLFLFLGACLLLAEGMRVAWYRVGEFSWEGVPTLIFSVPADAEILEIAGSRAADILSYDAATSVRLPVDESSGAGIELIFLEYEGGNGRLWSDLFTHSPEICLRRSGAILLHTYPHRSVNIEGRDLVFRHLLFQQPFGEQPVHVFKMIWLANMERLGVRGDDNDYRRGRLAAAKSRIVPPGTLTLAVVSGVERPEDAWRFLQARIQQSCRFESPNRSGRPGA